MQKIREAQEKEERKATRGANNNKGRRRKTTEGCQESQSEASETEDC